MEIQGPEILQEKDANTWRFSSRTYRRLALE